MRTLTGEQLSARLHSAQWCHPFIGKKWRGKIHNLNAEPKNTIYVYIFFITVHSVCRCCLLISFPQTFSFVCAATFIWSDKIFTAAGVDFSFATVARVAVGWYEISIIICISWQVTRRLTVLPKTLCTIKAQNNKAKKTMWKMEKKYGELCECVFIFVTLIAD